MAEVDHISKMSRNTNSRYIYYFIVFFFFLIFDQLYYFIVMKSNMSCEINDFLGKVRRTQLFQEFIQQIHDFLLDFLIPHDYIRI